MLFFSSCENDPEEVKKLSESKELPALTSLEIEIFYTDSAILKAKLKAPMLREFSGTDPYSELPYGVKVEFFDDNGNVNSELSANYAIHFKNKDIMEARNNVIVVNKKGEKLNTELLIWDNRAKKLRTDAFVKITTGEEVLYGEGLEANQDFSKHRILIPQGSFDLKDETTEPQ